MEEGRVVAVGEGGVVVLAVVGHGAGVVGEGVEMLAVFTGELLPDLLPELGGLHGLGGQGQVDCLLLDDQWKSCYPCIIVQYPTILVQNQTNFVYLKFLEEDQYTVRYGQVCINVHVKKI